MVSRTNGTCASSGPSRLEEGRERLFRELAFGVVARCLRGLRHCDPGCGGGFLKNGATMGSTERVNLVACDGVAPVIENSGSVERCRGIGAASHSNSGQNPRGNRNRDSKQRGGKRNEAIKETWNECGVRERRDSVMMKEEEDTVTQRWGAASYTPLRQSGRVFSGVVICCHIAEEWK
jgi:hypothetical protein